MQTASQKQEKQIARLLGGKAQPNSGGTRFGGGDVHTKRFLIEAKTCEKQQKSFTIQAEWVDKAAMQAFAQGKDYAAVAIRFAPDEPDYYLIDEDLMKALVKHLETRKRGGQH